MPEVTFHGRLSAWRNKQGLTQEQAANAIGVGLERYGDWERGRTLPRGDLWQSVFQTAGVDPSPYWNEAYVKRYEPIRSRFRRVPNGIAVERISPKRPAVAPACRVELGLGGTEMFPDIVSARRAMRRRHVVECKIIRVADNRMLDEWVAWQPGLDIAAEIAKRDAA